MSNGHRVQLPLLLDAKAVAGLLSISKATLYRMIDRGDFPRPKPVSVGTVRWKRETVLQFIDKLFED